ncbi:MAG: DUF1566 domain-containing protein [Hyphomicrobiaceae bacterium]
METFRVIVALVAGLGLPGAVQAALVDRGGGLIYDTDLNVTWLADANYARTSGYAEALQGAGSDGRMTWGQAEAWVAQLAYHDAVRNVDLKGWRLPTTRQPDQTCSVQAGGDSYGYNCTGSELGHLFYKELGGKTATPISKVHNGSYSLFSHGPASLYWSGTTYGPDASRAWGFMFDSGSSLAGGKGNRMYVLPVRPGDVGTGSR